MVFKTAKPIHSFPPLNCARAHFQSREMEQLRTEWWEEGYVVIPDVLSADAADEVLARLDSLQYAPMKRVGFEGALDYSRAITSDISAVLTPALVHMISRVRHCVEEIDQRWKLQELRVVRTMAGSEEQCPHRDLDVEFVHKTIRHEHLVQASVILSLTGATEVIYSRCTDFAETSRKQDIYLEPNSIMVYRADLIHSKPASTHDFFTVQAFFSAGKFSWPTTTDPIAVAFKLRKCPFCPFMGPSTVIVHNHARYCEENPTLPEQRARRRERYKIPRKCDDCGVVFPSQNTYQKHKPKCGSL